MCICYVIIFHCRFLRGARDDTASSGGGLFESRSSVMPVDSTIGARECSGLTPRDSVSPMSTHRPKTELASFEVPLPCSDGMTLRLEILTATTAPISQTIVFHPPIWTPSHPLRQSFREHDSLSRTNRFEELDPARKLTLRNSYFTLYRFRRGAKSRSHCRFGTRAEHLQYTKR